MEYKRLTLFAGHYGSGKTNIALNYARALNRIFSLPVKEKLLYFLRPGTKVILP